MIPLPPVPQAVHHAEQAYLGACMFDPKAYWDAGHVEPEDFAHAGHAKIFEAIQVAMRGEGAAEPVLVDRCLLAADRDALHGYLHELVEATPTGSTAVFYADVVRLHSRIRRVYQAMRIGFELSESGTLDEATATLMQAIEKMRLALEVQGGYSDFALAVRHADRIADPSTIREISSTIPSLDQVLGGLSGPRLYVLGARPSVGKSLLAGQIAINAAVHGDRAIGFVSLEMSDGQLMARMLAYLGMKGSALGDKSPRMYFDCRTTDLGDITSRIRQWHHRHAIDLAIVDYVQLVRAPQYGRARYEQLGAVSCELKRLAMEIKIPVLALAQLSREHEKAGRHPSLADLRESGNIEQDADVVLLLHPNEDRRHAEIALAKNRDGRAGLVVDLEFSPARLGLVERL
jgi:replicative DNA helicase